MESQVIFVIHLLRVISELTLSWLTRSERLTVYTIFVIAIQIDRQFSLYVSLPCMFWDCVRKNVYRLYWFVFVCLTKCNNISNNKSM